MARATRKKAEGLKRRRPPGCCTRDTHAARASARAPPSTAAEMSRGSQRSSHGMRVVRRSAPTPPATTPRARRATERPSRVRDQVPAATPRPATVTQIMRPMHASSTQARPAAPSPATRYARSRARMAALPQLKAVPSQAAMAIPSGCVVSNQGTCRKSASHMSQEGPTPSATYAPTVGHGSGEASRGGQWAGWLSASSSRRPE
mmetsp:Transcript_16484/g.55434  ORF Transcript_16484/g.55434 Transcript_16484/m.55434 type:complete len:204 (+) Transcript_16484:205-816(+)